MVVRLHWEILPLVCGDKKCGTKGTLEKARAAAATLEARDAVRAAAALQTFVVREPLPGHRRPLQAQLFFFDIDQEP